MDTPKDINETQARVALKPRGEGVPMSDEYTLKVGDLDILTEHDEALLFVMFAMLSVVMKLGFMVPGDVYSMVRDMGRVVPADQDLSDEAQNTRDIDELLKLMERFERAGGVALIVGE